MRALLYLTLRRFINSVKRVPRNPRLLVPVLVFGFVFIWPLLGFFLLNGETSRRDAPVILTPADLLHGDAGRFAASIRALLLLSVFGSVVAAYSEGNLFFTPPDIDFLFPAPLRRRSVLFFKMVGTYLSLLLPVLYFPFFLGASLAAQWGTTPLVFWPGMVAAWLLLVTSANVTQVFLLGRADTGDDDRRRTMQKTLAAVGFLLGAVVLILIYLFMTGPGADGLSTALRVLNSRLIAILFFPITWTVDLFFVAVHGGWDIAGAGKMLFLTLLAAGSFLLLFSRDRDFYEGAMTVSARRHRLVTAVQRGNANDIVLQMVQEGKITRRAGVTALPSLGTGALAIVWRDLLATLRTPTRSWMTLLLFAIVPALFGRGAGTGAPGVGVILWLVLFTINVSNVFLLSIRGMLRRADITKTLPISPPRLLLAENVVSMAMLTILGWLSLGAMWLMGVAFGPLMGLAFAALPSLAMLILLVQTCFVLVYPNREDQAQNAVGNLLGLLASTLSLLPAGLIGAALGFSGAGYAVITAAVVSTNLISAAAALAFASFLWQRFDPTD